MLNFVLPTYLLGSLLLFLRPSLLHARHGQPPLFQQALKRTRIINIAHRGGCRKAIQNTIAAFDHAVEHADMLEMDVIQTKDGVLVVHHDRDLERTCGVDKEVGEFTSSQLPGFQEEVLMHFSEKELKIKCKEQKIPTLQEVFHRYPNIPMSVQIKFPSQHSIKELKRLILNHNRLDITIVGVASPFEPFLEQQFPQSNRFISYGSLPKLILLYVTGLLPFMEIKEKVMQIPLYSVDYHANRTRIFGDTWNNWLFFKMLKMSYYLTLPLVWHLRQRGILTFYWVCNRNQYFKKAIDGGACGIMTDDPEMLQEYLKGVDLK